MLPQIRPEHTLDPHYHAYLQMLKNTHFSGEIKTDYATRLAVATDNSVYQVVPQAVLLPRSHDDILVAMQLAQQEAFKQIQFAPRGGGTGTNGQSLSGGIIIDCSQYMRQILEINLQEQWVRVQPGVVLDQLNVFLKSHGMCFAPQISPSNRATIGGMVNTDACGNGSKVLGRTSDHVISLQCVLSNGDVVLTHDNNEALAKQLHQASEPHQVLIKEKFVERPRNLNGYNLLKSVCDQINLNYLFCGSEGTLGIITEAKLRISPTAKYKKLVLVKYKNFDDALNSHHYLDAFKPLVVEAIDETLVTIAREDSIYLQIKEMLDGAVSSGAINLVEFVARSEAELEESVSALCLYITNENQQSHAPIGYYVAKNDAEIKLLWELRKKSVGLVSKRKQGTRRPIPFVEDTAVPPERLAAYISEFRAILDKHGLIYGMYGHVDAGCVHVRPALDLKQSEDETLFRTISDEVVALVKKHHGVMWGEHGLGFRCHYAEEFFGKELYKLVRQIKTIFDPHNRFNPGKIAVPLNTAGQLVDIGSPLRAQRDKYIPAAWQQDYANSMACNGNGACFNFATQDPMCPSYKVTLDRVHSPKGRATVVREWLHQLARTSFRFENKRFNVKKIFTTFTRKDFSHEVYAAMNGCLSCKSCAAQCPVNVDVPEFKSKFLNIYHQRYLRPLRDYVIGMTESIVVWQTRFPRVTSFILQTTFMQWCVKKLVRMEDVPQVAVNSLNSELKKRDAPQFNASLVNDGKSIILIQDAFTTFYDVSVVLKTYDFLSKLGLAVYVLPFFPNGKTWHVRGFLQRFARIANKNISYLREIAKSQIPMIGLDPSVTLTYRDEYKKIIGTDKLGFEIWLLQEWLVKNKNLLSKAKSSTTHQYVLLSHCTEKTAHAAAEAQWREVFAELNLQLTPQAVGCCGMAGSYGHEVEHKANSKALFQMDWERVLQENANSGVTVLATGYSCRSQVKRLQGIVLQHPVEVL